MKDHTDPPEASAKIYRRIDGSFERLTSAPLKERNRALTFEIEDTRIPVLYAGDESLWVDFRTRGHFDFGESADAVGVENSDKGTDHDVASDNGSEDIREARLQWYQLPVTVDHYHETQLIGRQNLEHLAMRYMSQTFDRLADIAENEPEMRAGLAELVSCPEYLSEFDAINEAKDNSFDRPRRLVQRAPELFPFKCD